MADRDALISGIVETERQLRHKFMGSRDHPLLDVNLTISQLKVMIVLSREGGAAGRELAERTGFSLATLTGIADRLVGQQLVTRQEDPRDRRVRRLELTPEGAALVGRLVAAGEAHQQRVLRRLDTGQLATVAEAFAILLAAADDPPERCHPSPEAR